SHSGTTTATFTVSLSGPSGLPVSVDYSTADGSAMAGDDYTPQSGRLTFAPGETTKSISVSVLGASGDELDETFLLDLRNPVNATIARAEGVGTIRNDGTSARGQVLGSVYEDLNGDGVRDPGEPGLSGWTVYLDRNGDGRLDA